MLAGVASKTLKSQNVQGEAKKPLIMNGIMRKDTNKMWCGFCYQYQYGLVAGSIIHLPKKEKGKVG